MVICVLLKLGLLEDDNHYHLAMQEASFNKSSSTIHALFAIVLAWCEPSNPIETLHAMQTF